MGDPMETQRRATMTEEISTSRQEPVLSEMVELVPGQEIFFSLSRAHATEMLNGGFLPYSAIYCYGKFARFGLLYGQLVVQLEEAQFGYPEGNDSMYPGALNILYDPPGGIIDVPVGAILHTGTDVHEYLEELNRHAH